jgi:phosphonate transport system substrate-binding protein
MRPTRCLVAALAAVALVAAGCAAPDQEPRRITIAIQPTESADVISTKAPALAAFLEARMAERGFDVDIQVYAPTAYVSVVDALRFGHADVAMMSAWPMSLAHDKAGAEVVLAEEREVMHGANATTAPYYYSYYIVRPDSPHTSLADLRGATVAFPSATSTSGYVFPVAKLVQSGLVAAPAKGELDPGQFFGRVQFAGGYPQAWEALRNGQVDAAVTAGDINAKLFAEVLDGSKVVETQGPIPSHGVVFAKGFLGTPEAAALKESFLELKGEHRDLMRSLVSGIFVEFSPTTTQEHIAGLSEALRVTGLKFTERA